MKLSRRDILLGTAAAAGVGACGGPAARPLNLVVVMVDGGWDLTFTFDPKPGVPGVDGPYVDRDPMLDGDEEVVRSWGALDVTTNEARRPRVSRFFDRWGMQTAAVRGVWVGSVSHWIGRRRLLSGLDDARAPDLLTRVGQAHAARRPLGVVDLSNVGRFGQLGHISARGGLRGQLGQVLDPPSRYPMADGTVRPSLAQSDAERSAVDAWLATSSPEPVRDEALRLRAEARDRAAQLRAAAPGLTIPAPGPQGAGGMSTLAASLLATETAGAVIVDSGLIWDTHVNHVSQHAKFDSLFFGVDTLLTELSRVGVLDHTLVVVMSEMMRTPWRNDEGGTEHWPYSGLLLAGGRIPGGVVHGSTDERLVGQPARGSLLTYDRVVAGILEHVGVDITPWSGVSPLALR